MKWGVEGCDPPTPDLLFPFRHLLTSSKDLTRVLICLWPLLPSIMLLRIWKGQRREGRSPDPSPLWVPLLPPHPSFPSPYFLLVLILQFCIQEVQGHRLPEVGGLGEAG